MEPTFFADQKDFRAWLHANHLSETELLVGFWKVSSGKPSMTWSESVDQALCYGWIDGVRRSINEESYSIRFSPRKPKSVWSLINANKVKAMIEQGLMQPAGLAAWEKRPKDESEFYSLKARKNHFLPEHENIFKANKTAWEFFTNQAPYYQRTMIFWIESAKQDATRESRLRKLIELSAEGKRR